MWLNLQFFLFFYFVRSVMASISSKLQNSMDGCKIFYGIVYGFTGTDCKQLMTTFEIIRLWMASRIEKKTYPDWSRNLYGIPMESLSNGRMSNFAKQTHEYN